MLPREQKKPHLDPPHAYTYLPHLPVQKAMGILEYTRSSLVVAAAVQKTCRVLDTRIQLLAHDLSVHKMIPGYEHTIQGHVGERILD
jgi:hypothetical protein